MFVAGTATCDRLGASPSSRPDPMLLLTICFHLCWQLHERPSHIPSAVDITVFKSQCKLLLSMASPSSLQQQ